jgi:phage tail-like protein
MPTGSRADPYPAFRFRVEFNGLIVARASEVTGLQRETTVESYEEGGTNTFVHQLPGRTKYQNLVLKRGITDDPYLWDWHEQVLQGMVERRNGMIVLMDPEGEERWRWVVLKAFPVKWIGPDLKADAGSVAFESVEFAHHGIVRG